MSKKDFLFNYNYIDKSANSLVFPKYDKVGIKFLTDKEILELSYGEVKSSETANYRKKTPEKNGLLGSAIFGPVNDFECECKKYRGDKYLGVICDKCNVLVAQSRVRRQRFGHIALNLKIIHPLMVHHSNIIYTILNITKSKFLEIIHYSIFVCCTKENIKYKEGTCIPSSEYYEIDDFDSTYGFLSGADAIEYMLLKITPTTVDEIDKHIKQIKDKMKLKNKKNLIDINLIKQLINRKNLIISFFKNYSSFSDLILTKLPVMPTDLRPIISISGRFASSERNELYKNVLNRNNRLNEFQLANGIDIVIYTEKRLLIDAIHELMCSIDSKENKKQSISDMLKGKFGFIRRVMLGKRVDYSARAVIIPGGDLTLDKAGIPKTIAIELFKPIIMGELEKCGYLNFKARQQMIAQGHYVVYDILDRVVKKYRILLNRAPTLHSLSMQSFKIKLIEGNSIKIHPLVCAPFNADFDGDTVTALAVFTDEAIKECENYSAANKNIMLPSNVTPILAPAKDIVLGIYYSTLINDNKAIYIDNLPLMNYMCSIKKINQNTKIEIKINNKKYITTPGRIYFWFCCPEHKNIDFEIFNKTFIKKDISNLVTYIYKNYGCDTTCIFLDKIKDFGFNNVAQSGISFSQTDAIIPSDIEGLIQDTNKTNKSYDEYIELGIITKHEANNQSVNNWLKCSEKIKESIQNILKSNIEITDRNGVQINNVFAMMQSGSRGSITQITQLCGMRGMMAKQSGSVVSRVIPVCLKTGLDPIHYFISTYGKRKSLMDLQQRTGQSGYLLRKLVIATNNYVIRSISCKTKHGIYLDNYQFKKFNNLIIGKFTALDVMDKDNNIIFKRGTLINDEKFEILLEKANKICMRNSITCMNQNRSICAKCYGVEITTNKIVDLNTAVGVRASQSCGEPIMQFTMQTSHQGGVVQILGDKKHLTNSKEGIVDLSDLDYVINSNNERVIMSYNGKIKILDKNKNVIETIDAFYHGHILNCKEGEYIKKDTVLFDINNFNIPIISKFDGKVKFQDIMLDATLDIINNQNSTVKIYQIIKNKLQHKGLHPRIDIVSNNGKIIDSYSLPANTILQCTNDSVVKKGDLLAKIMKTSYKTQDITSNLPNVINLLEARSAKNKAIIAINDGYVKITHSKSGERVTIIPKELYKKTDEESLRKIENLPHTTVDNNIYLEVQESSYVNKGDKISSGVVYIGDLLDVLGLNVAILYIIAIINEQYTSQGILIHMKHIEVIVKSLFSICEITNYQDPEIEKILQNNSSLIINNNYIALSDVLFLNDKLSSENLPLIEYKNMFVGITKYSSEYNNSFLTAVAFQNCIKRLTDAAYHCKESMLTGVTDNVLLCRKLKERKPINLEDVVNID